MALRNRGVVVFIALALAGGGNSLSAQRGLGVGGGVGVYGLGPRLGENIDLALQFREQLNLSGEQVVALQELQVAIQQDVAPLEAEIDDLRARIMSGEVMQVAGVSQLQDLFNRYQAAATPYRTGVATILTADQHWELQGLMYDSRLGQGAYVGRAGSGIGRGFGLSAGRGYWGPGGGVGLGRGLRRGVRRGGGRGLGRGLMRDRRGLVWERLRF
ncbi:hypothetical protein ACFL3S_05175 [Gemmatimonadota bacterium]